MTNFIEQVNCGYATRRMTCEKMPNDNLYQYFNLVKGIMTVVIWRT